MLTDADSPIAKIVHGLGLGLGSDFDQWPGAHISLCYWEEMGYCGASVD